MARGYTDMQYKELKKVKRKFKSVSENLRADEAPIEYFKIFSYFDTYEIAF